MFYKALAINMFILRVYRILYTRQLNETPQHFDMLLWA